MDSKSRVEQHMARQRRRWKDSFLRKQKRLICLHFVTDDDSNHAGNRTPAAETQCLKYSFAVPLRGIIIWHYTWRYDISRLNHMLCDVHKTYTYSHSSLTQCSVWFPAGGGISCFHDIQQCLQANSWVYLSSRPRLFPPTTAVASKFHQHLVTSDIFDIS